MVKELATPGSDESILVLVINSLTATEVILNVDS